VPLGAARNLSYAALRVFIEMSGHANRRREVWSTQETIARNLGWFASIVGDRPDTPRVRAGQNELVAVDLIRPDGRHVHSDGRWTKQWIVAPFPPTEAGSTPASSPATDAGSVPASVGSRDAGSTPASSWSTDAGKRSGAMQVIPADDAGSQPAHNRESFALEQKNRNSVSDVAYDTTSDARRLCDRLANNIAGYARKPKITDRWLAAADRLLRVDKVDLGEAIAVIDWLTTSDAADAEFWRPTVLSMPTLRKHFDTLRMQMHRDEPRMKSTAADEERLARQRDEDRRKQELVERLRPWAPHCMSTHGNENGRGYFSFPGFLICEGCYTDAMSEPGGVIAVSGGGEP
jgi:hypothetical protein